MPWYGWLITVLGVWFLGLGTYSAMTARMLVKQQKEITEKLDELKDA